MENASTQSFKVMNVLDEAWNLLKGSKWKIWLGLLGIVILLMFLNFIIAKALGYNLDTMQNMPLWATYGLFPLLTNILIAPIYAGCIMVGIKRARNESLTSTAAYKYFHMYIPLAITMVLVNLIPTVIALLLNIAITKMNLGVNRSIAEIIIVLVSVTVYSFLLLSMPLVADRHFSPLTAIKTSIQKISPHWPKVFLLLLIGYVFLFVSAIPMSLGRQLENSMIILVGSILFVIAVVWLIPFLFMIQSMIYHHLVDKEDAIAAPSNPLRNG